MGYGEAVGLLADAGGGDGEAGADSAAVAADRADREPGLEGLWSLQAPVAGADTADGAGTDEGVTHELVVRMRPAGGVERRPRRASWPM